MPGAPNLIVVAAVIASLAPQGAAAQSGIDPQRLIRAWAGANGDCRGGPGDSNRTFEACGRREAFGEILGEMGWCHGRRGEAGYQTQWHRCEATSNQQRLPE